MAVSIWVSGTHLAATATLLGAAGFRAYVAGPALGDAASALNRALRRLALAGAAVALTAWFARLTLQVATLPADTGLAVLLSQTRFGTVWLAHSGLVLAAAAALLAGSLWRVAAGLAAAALGVLPFAGHAAALVGPDQTIALSAQVVHVVAGSAWVGMLAPLLIALRNRPAEAGRLAHRFSPFGMGCVAALALSSLASVCILVASIPALLGTAYGRWACAKLALFSAMLVCAAVNRYRWTPALEAGAGTPRRLAASIAVEAAIGIAVLFAAAELSTIPPAIHDSPVWPLPFRLATEFLADPGLRNEALTAAVELAAAIALLGLAMRDRRLRWFVLLPAAVLAAVSVPTWRVFLVEAYPTTFARSPTGFTAASVTRGAALFQEDCTACHGREGRGDGPAAGGGVAPDLTAAHVLDHREGDLFWWISEGIPRARMPGFRDAVDDDGRWALVDFVRANAFGRGAADDPDRPATIRAPDFPFECPDGTADTLADVAAPDAGRGGGSGRRRDRLDAGGHGRPSRRLRSPGGRRGGCLRDPRGKEPRRARGNRIPHRRGLGARDRRQHRLARSGGVRRRRPARRVDACARRVGRCACPLSAVAVAASLVTSRAERSYSKVQNLIIFILKVRPFLWQA
jgi:putative copper export protein/mono/diheme cytochrome c family protein